MPRLIAIFVGFLLSCQLARAEPFPTNDEIARAIADLGSPEFGVRQAASDLLWKAGEAAEPALLIAQRSDDPETRTRAAYLLDKLRQGIGPETPADVLVLVEQLHRGPTTEERQQAARQLQAKQHWRPIIAAVRAEADGEVRRLLAAPLVADSGKIVGPLIKRGQWDETDAVLETLALADDSGIPQWLSFLTVTGRLDRQIALARSRADELQSEISWAWLSFLLRAKGDVAGAIKAAAHTPNTALQFQLHIEAGRWSSAAAIAEQEFDRHQDRLGIAAAAATCYRLAENDSDCARMLAAVVQRANVDRLLKGELDHPGSEPSKAEGKAILTKLVVAAKALILNERIDEGLAIMERINPAFAHRVYWWQHRHGEALRFARVTPTKTLDKAWLDELPTPVPLLEILPGYRLQMVAQIARELRDLGCDDQIDQIWETLNELEVPDTERGKHLTALARLGWQLRRYDDALAKAAAAIAAGVSPAEIFKSLLGREGPLALAWHERQLAANRTIDPRKAVATAAWMVMSRPPEGKLPKNWRQIVVQARQSVQSLPGASKAARLVAFGQTCLIRGDRKLAASLFEEAAKADPRTASHIGDLRAQVGDWNEAVRHYTAAAEAAPDEAAPNYLLGHALIWQGDSRQGEERLLSANLMVLAPQARINLTRSFLDWTLKADKIDQMELVWRTAIPGEIHVGNASQEIGNVVSTYEPLRSAHLWQQHFFRVLLYPQFNFTEPEAYPDLLHEIAMVRARAAIDRGDVQTAAKELTRSQAASPGDIRTATELVPMLRRGGMDSLADELFESMLQIQLKIAEEFPASAMYLNNAAWLCARCQQKLADALSLAEKAVALAPEIAAYRDTLAEVHFQRGNRSAAVAEAQKAVELAGATPFTAARLRHFQHDELRSLDRLAQ